MGLLAWWNLMIISNESMDFNDPQLFGDQLEVWTLIIQKSTVIPPSLMVLFLCTQGPPPMAEFRETFQPL